MQLGGVDVELGDHAHGQLGQKRRAVGVEQARQRPPDAVVAPQPHLAAGQSPQRRVVRCGPLGQGVHGPVAEHEVADHHADHRGRRQPYPPVAAGQVLVEQPGQPEPVAEVAHDRQAVQALADQPRSLEVHRGVGVCARVGHARHLLLQRLH